MSSREFTITLLLVIIVLLFVMTFFQRVPEPRLPIVEAAMPIIAPARSAPCNIPPPAPRPVRTA